MNLLTKMENYNIIDCINIHALKRHILTEKYVAFEHYNNPWKVPDWLWEYVYSKISDSNLTYVEVWSLYISLVIAPLLKIQEYSIVSPIIIEINSFIKQNKDACININDANIDSNIGTVYLNIKQFYESRYGGAKTIKKFTHEVWDRHCFYIFEKLDT